VQTFVLCGTIFKVLVMVSAGGCVAALTVSEISKNYRREIYLIFTLESNSHVAESILCVHYKGKQANHLTF
jgi:hypothetical protein